VICVCGNGAAISALVSIEPDAFIFQNRVAPEYITRYPSPVVHVYIESGAGKHPISKSTNFSFALFGEFVVWRKFTLHPLHSGAGITAYSGELASNATVSAKIFVIEALAMVLWSR
jgi:hypothetical protein